LVTLAIFTLQVALVTARLFNGFPPLYRYIHGGAIIGVLLTFNLLMFVVIKSYLDEDSPEGTYRLAAQLLSVTCPLLIVLGVADCFVLAALVLGPVFAGAVVLLILLSLLALLCSQKNPSRGRQS
jgi:hypothetical protein